MTHNSSHDRLEVRAAHIARLNADSTTLSNLTSTTTAIGAATGTSLALTGALSAATLTVNSNAMLATTEYTPTITPTNLSAATSEVSYYTRCGDMVTAVIHFSTGYDTATGASFTATLPVAPATVGAVAFAVSIYDEDASDGVAADLAFTDVTSVMHVAFTSVSAHTYRVTLSATYKV